VESMCQLFCCSVVSGGWAIDGTAPWEGWVLSRRGCTGCPGECCNILWWPSFARGMPTSICLVLVVNHSGTIRGCAIALAVPAGDSD